MNALLAQFLAEAADLLAQVDEGLLQLEREPGDPALVNEVFRVAHTFKGSSGLFAFPELTRLTHAAEDLLDAVRGGGLSLDSGMTDDLLASFDLIRGWLAHVTTHERLPSSAAGDAARLITKLRAPLGGEKAQDEAAAVVHVARRVVPAWLDHFDQRWLTEASTWLRTTSSRMRFLRYTPDQGCFFRAEDPLHLVSEIPAVDRVDVVTPDSWPPEFDAYACLIGFVVATRAGVGEIDYLFRYVGDQIEVVELDGEAIRRHLTGEPPTATPHDPELVADAQAVLAGALRCLTLGDTISGTRLSATAHAVGAAARALGEPVDAAEADPPELREIVTRLLGDAAPTEAEVPPRPAIEMPADKPDRAHADDPGGQVGTKILKVDQEKVDHLMELVGELNVAKNGLPFLADAAEEEFGSRVLSRRIRDQHAGLHRIAEDLQAAVMDVRMLPLSVAFNRFPRLVRDLGRRLGKSVELTVHGEDTMADKDVIEALGDPLVHLVRNSLDHGVETPAERLASGKPPTARITLAAVADGDAVTVEIGDDGRGVDPDRVKRKAYQKGLISEDELETLGEADAVDLVFRPGFSTAEQVSDLSGRGVGMDAVRAGVAKLGGTVTMKSEPGRGTSTTLRLPLSMAVTQVMVVSVAGQRFGVPVDLVQENIRVPAAEMSRMLHSEVVVLRGEVVPVIDLARVLEMPWTPDPDSDRAILVVSLGDRRAGLLVERFHREVDVLLKPMEGLLAYAGEFAGTALLGDGLVLLVLNVKEVLGLADRVS
ncbi:chemotaxis protein CheA [Actinoplanes sp. TBRC 11911]|uniref:chemotaxis protein CheA n=1 Tax=Actinoplanes sp. TBRC 11911 TaxID=2729386 RepID=UPI00145EF68E|nr:chemotaxis protein CheA [Actinoplanes sp. TBRC 11911]NMO54161.1 chemotaxis protein CheA [Actinoplanes sp. TBRC 11911]